MNRRAELGQWFTAAPVARLAIAALGGIAPDERVIDPTCGDGAFLAAALAVGARRVVGIEIDADAAARAREVLRSHRADPMSPAREERERAPDLRAPDAPDVHAPDALASGVLAPGGLAADVRAPDVLVSDVLVSDVLVSDVLVSDVLVSDVLAPDLVERVGLFDVAIGNPPYVRAGRIDPAIKRARARVLAADWPELSPAVIDTIARHADVSATCLLRTLRLVRPGGRVALIVSTALLDADGASALWDAIAQVATIEALIVAPAERWFADAAVNSMLLVARRRTNPTGTSAATAPQENRGRASVVSVRPADSVAGPRILRLAMPTRDVVEHARSLDDIARASAHAPRSTEHGTPHAAPLGMSRSGASVRHERATVRAWGPALRAPAVWFAWCERARAQLVPLGQLCDVRRGLTTGANDVFYVRRDEATRLRLERRFLAPVVRSPFNGAPAAIAIAPDESPLVAIAVPPDAKLARAPRIKAWLDRHEASALATSAARRDPWWSLPVNPARLFFAKAYGPRFVQRLADTPMLADQRVYALHPKSGVDLVALAAVLNALPTALALESLGRRSMGYGVVEWTVNDALELPVLDVRRANADAVAEMSAALGAIARRPMGHVRLERDEVDRRRLDRAVLALAPGGELEDAMWEGLCASVAQRDRYLLPSV